MENLEDLLEKWEKLPDPTPSPDWEQRVLTRLQTPTSKWYRNFYKIFLTIMVTLNCSYLYFAWQAGSLNPRRVRQEVIAQLFPEWVGDSPKPN
jgi:hypothetical protein